MLRRMLPTLVILGLGLLALLAGLGSLQRIFLAEREDAHARVQAERNALREYAHRTLEQFLEAQLHDAEAQIELARGDPLMGTANLLLVEDGRLRFPRQVAYAPGDAMPARTLYESLRRRSSSVPVEEPDSPWATRVRLFRAFQEAIVQGSTPAIERSFRDILRHRALYVIPSELDIPYTLALLDYFVERSDPSPEVLASLLRDGLREGQVTIIEGIQPALLRRRERFTIADFQFLSGKAIDLSERAQTDVDDFRARVAEPVTVPPPVPHHLDEPSLLLGGSWYARPTPNEAVVGVSVSVADLLAAIEDQMHARALLEPEDTLVRPRWSEGPVPLRAFQIDVTSPRFVRAIADSDHRFWVKTGFVALSGTLAMVIAVLAFAIQSRKQRFVELKSDFVATVSHELRTPLTSIRLMAETVERRTSGLGTVRDYPTRIVREIDELAFLVENILSFNRLDKGRWKPRCEAVVLRDLVDELEQEVTPPGGRRLDLRLEHLDDVILEGDRELLKLMLRNLLKNGCSYNESAIVEITLRTRSRGNRWILEVADNGIGIPPGEHRRIFSDFYRAPGTEARGSGLGLAICRKTMQAHGGRIRVARSSAAGTVFELEFPATMVQS